MDTQPSAETPESIYLGPRYLVTSTRTDHDDHLVAFADANRWTYVTHRATAEVTSPCERIALRQQHDAAARRPHLTITARSRPDAPERWRVAVTGGMPVEFLSTLTHALATGLNDDPDALVYGVGPGSAAPIAVDADTWEPFEAYGLNGFCSLDDHAAIVARPQGSDAPAADGDESICWKIGAAPDVMPGELWSATFTYGAPTHIVAALINEMSRTEPLIRPVTSTIDPRLAPLLRYWPVPDAAPPLPSRSADTRNTPPDRAQCGNALPRPPRHGR